MAGDQHSSSSQSSSVSIKTRSFDVSKEGDLLQLLNFIRQSSLPEETKVEMQHAVLDYTTSQEKNLLASVGEHLKSQSAFLIDNGLPLYEDAEALKKPAAVNAAQKAGGSSLGVSRPKPSFGKGSVAPAPAPQPAKSAGQFTPDSVTSAAPDMPDASEAPAPAKEKEAAPATQPSDAPPEVKSEKTIPPDPSQTPASQSVPAEPAPTTANQRPDPLTRIKEIKRDINQKVGNPVNLIDVDNEVGREYMNSLLNAMKVLNGGTTDEVVLAMDRLEAAFVQAKESIASSETATPDSAPTAPPAEKAVKDEVSTPVKESPTVPETPAASAPAKPAADTPPPEPAPPAPAKPVETKLTQPATIANPPAAAKDVQKEDVQKPEPAPEPAVATAAQAPADNKVQSVAAQLASEEKKRQSTLASKAAEIKAKEGEPSTDPLQAPEITSGLNQLLNEWKLFKGSGIFGTGPSGVEHPLYKQLAVLPMAAVIANRFEGATPEIKQSITDYMNGWRYEQGIVHEMGETFEHYLRRVIKTILDSKTPVSKA